MWPNKRRGWLFSIWDWICLLLLRCEKIIFKIRAKAHTKNLTLGTSFTSGESLLTWCDDPLTDKFTLHPSLLVFHINILDDLHHIRGDVISSCCSIHKLLPITMRFMHNLFRIRLSLCLSIDHCHTHNALTLFMKRPSKPKLFSGEPSGSL